MFKKGLIIALALVAITLTTSAQQRGVAKWVRVNTEQGISFMMPTTPSTDWQVSDGIPTYIYSSRDLTCIYRVVCSDFSKNPEILNVEYRGRMLELLKSGSIPMEDYGKLTSEKYINEEEPFVYEIRYTAEYERKQWSYIKHFIIEGDYLYQFTIGSKTRNYDELKNSANRFLSSYLFDQL